MNYIYDVYLNFKNALYDFFEWNTSDNLIHLKKIPIYKIGQKTFNSFCSNKIKLNNNFLNNIKYKTEIWKNKKNIKYCSLFCTNNHILAIYFDDQGTSTQKSFLYIDEELEILESIYNLKEIKINYKIVKKEYQSLKTRTEKYKEKFIKNNLKNINEDKLNYIYFECFGKKNSKKNMLYELNNIDSNNDNYKNLYNILKLISSIKK